MIISKYFIREFNENKETYLTFLNCKNSKEISGALEVTIVDTKQ